MTKLHLPSNRSSITSPTSVNQSISTGICSACTVTRNNNNSQYKMFCAAQQLH